LALGLVLGVCGCGGSGDGGGGGGSTPVNLVNFQAASDIIGQSTVTGRLANNGGSVTPNQSGVFAPNAHVAIGSLYVPDGGNNRILGFNSVPTGLGANADFVLGQADFGSNTSGTSATKFNGPISCWVSNGVLFVADFQNERVLLFSPPPTSAATPATLALGQPDLTTQGPSAGTTGLSSPVDVCAAGNRIVVADASNHRVMIWNGIPPASGAPAQLVVGQPDFTTVTSGATAGKMALPLGVWTDGTRLVVADTGNNRVLIWTTFPTVNGQLPDLVVGQPDFTTNTPGDGASKMASPKSACSDGSQLFVADSFNNRVLIFSPFPTASNPAATGVLGQSNFTNVAANDDDQNGVQDATASARTMANPSGVTTLGNRLFVLEEDNNRVTIFTGS
jgi:hypothetical protein